MVTLSLLCDDGRDGQETGQEKDREMELVTNQCRESGERRRERIDRQREDEAKNKSDKDAACEEEDQCTCGRIRLREKERRIQSE